VRYQTEPDNRAMYRFAFCKKFQKLLSLTSEGSARLFYAWSEHNARKRWWDRSRYFLALLWFTNFVLRYSGI